eukprot:6187280-Pleurochrysis_carterae.AAC.2
MLWLQARQRVGELLCDAVLSASGRKRIPAHNLAVAILCFPLENKNIDYMMRSELSIYQHEKEDFVCLIRDWLARVEACAACAA